MNLKGFILHKSHTAFAGNVAQPVEVIGGEGGTRTPDPTIMSL